ncbi:MAG: hypothetical protein J0H64_08340 [Actinobacteria bacterium]|nr:hypothetical protein [Actinomycetota bacterium]
MEMKLDLKDAKKAAERATKEGRRPMRMLHRWGVRSDHAYMAGFIAIGLALVLRLVSRSHREKSEHEPGWSGAVGKAAPLFFLIGLGLDREE